VTIHSIQRNRHSEIIGRYSSQDPSGGPPFNLNSRTATVDVTRRRCEDSPKDGPPFNLNSRTVTVDLTRRRCEDSPKVGPPFKGDKRGAQRRVRGITVVNPNQDPGSHRVEATNAPVN